jgi:MerR family transcriptional regulator, copper efflux regulator
MATALNVNSNNSKALLCEADGDCAAPGQMHEQTDLTIGALARITGIAAKTIRFYEEIGLLPPARRTANRYRRYGQADVNRLVLLRRIRLLGVPLPEAKPLLAEADDARCADVQRELLALVDARLAALDRELAELHALRDETLRYSRALAECDVTGDDLFTDCSDMRCLALPSERGAHRGD